MKAKHNFSARILAAVLVLVTIFGLCGNIIPAFAATEYDVPANGDTAYISVYNRIYRSDNGQKYVMSNGAHDMRDFKFNFEGHSDMRNYNPDTQLYCIQYGAPLPSDGKYTAITPSTFDYWEDFYQIQKEGILLAIAFGYPASSLEELHAATEDDAIAATQAIVWEFMTASRLSFDGHADVPTFYEEYIENTPAYDAYWNILNMAREYYEDTRYNFEDLLSKSDFVIWQCEGYQSLVSYNLHADKPEWKDEGYIAVKKMDTNLQPLAGAEFDIMDAEGKVVAHLGPTDAGGHAITADMLPFGTYTAIETVFPDGYTSTDTQSWTITLDEYAPDGVFTFYAFNVAETGFVGVIKTTQDIRPIEGVKFGIYQDAECETLMAVMTTEENGACVAEVPANQTVYIKEISVPNNSYVMSDTVYPVFVTKNMITVANNAEPIINYEKEWKLKVVKHDSDNGTLNAGDAMVVGAVYGLYDAADNLLAEYVVDQDGTFTTDAFTIGAGYYLAETYAPAGYQLDTTRHYLDRYTRQEVQGEGVTTHVMEIGEIVMTGTVSITKFTENPEAIGQFVVPEQGAEFVIYLKRFGSYEAAVASGDPRTYDTGIVDASGNVCWSTGNAVSKQLAYGTYVIHQVSSWDNRELVEDFDVEIKQQNQHFTFNLRNPYKAATLVVNKVDRETGKLIIASEAVFKIKNTETGEFVSVTDAATGTVITEFSTVNGVMSLPVQLPEGAYELIEVQSPAGYKAATASADFVVNEENRGVINLTVKNDPIMGKISLEKHGVQFVDVTEETSEYGVVYTPVFEIKYLEGAVFNIVAAEDIVTADGTVHYKKGDIVDVITSSADGVVYSKELYMGQYQVIEVSTPAGYCGDGQPVTVDLSGDGDLEIKVSMTNDRMATMVTLQKQAYVWETAESENGISVEQKLVPGEGFVFGIYSGETFTAANGDVIQTNALMGIMVTDENGAANMSDALPYGKFYAKELKAANDYPYILSEDYPFELNPENAENNQITVAINNGQPIINQFTSYEVELNKVDKETGAHLAGSLFEVKDEAGNTIRRGYTDENGIFKVVLLAGKYTFVEIEAPEGYVLNENAISFEVKDDGTIEGKIVMENEAIPDPGPEPTPDTGDSIMTFFVLIAVSAISLVLLAMRKRKLYIK